MVSTPSPFLVDVCSPVSSTIVSFKFRKNVGISPEQSPEVGTRGAGPAWLESHLGTQFHESAAVLRPMDQASESLIPQLCFSCS